MIHRGLAPTTEFESLARRALHFLVPAGSAYNHFRAPRGTDCYHGGVKPDFIMPDGRWVDFKLRVSFREKRGDVAWRPSALYSSLRKYIDHPANRHGTLTVVYRHLYGSIGDVDFPVRRGAKVLLVDAAEFERRVRFVDVERVLDRLRGTSIEWVTERIRAL